MPSSCPNCGWPRVEGARCPRCGVDVARYLADVAARADDAPGAAESAAPAAVAPAAPAATVPAVGLDPAPTLAAEARPAGFWIRVAALLVDVLCVMAAELVFGLLMWTLADDRLAAAAGRAFRFLAGPCYFVLMHWARGQTLGKMAFAIRVVDLAGGPLSLGQAVLRHVGAWLSALVLGLGYLPVAFRADKRGLHDLIAGTRVEHLA